MQVNIRQYSDKDFEMISDWWKQANEVGPAKDMLSAQTTFIMEINNVPAYSLSLYLTNCKGLAIFENFAGNPQLKGERKKFAPVLVNYLEDLAKSLGYKKIMCLSMNDKLVTRYTSLGYNKTVGGLTALVKEL
jgi:hypothetical protein